MSEFIIKIILVSLILIQVFSPANASQEKVYRFDFGPQGSPTVPGYKNLSEKSAYQKKTGYGLLSDEVSSFIHQESRLRNQVEVDGIISDSPILFKVDIPPGEYWIELLLPAGEHNTWRGSISINNTLIVSQIEQYEKNVEGDTPPVSWTTTMLFNTDQSHLQIEIKSDDQPAALTGINIFPKNIGPLLLENGKLNQSDRMSAPNSDFIVELINTGAVQEVHRLIDAIPEDQHGYEKAVFLMALAGRLETQHPRPLLEWAKILLTENYTATQDPSAALHLHIIEQYLIADNYIKMAGWDWAKKLTDESIFPRMDLAARAMECGSRLKGHPLQYRFSWELGKIAFMAWVEAHSDFNHKTAMENFNFLHQYYPDFRLLNVYLGERIPSVDEALEIDDPNAPEWAIKSAEALKQINDLIRYWVTARQAPNGEFGGKYDDDVEMLRWWFISRLASNNQLALTGMRKLVDGIWESGWITNGFSTKVRDVEHSSEPISDTQPMMIGLDFGNPTYVERCMESIKGIRDVWTGINEYGHRHFKSSWYSYAEIDSTPPKDCDVPMNTRTVRALRWLAWYNYHPYAIQFMKEWGDAWLEDSRRTDNGKPYGIVPSAIRYEDDRIGGHADNWHHPGMFWSYYNFRGGIRIMQQMLATYTLTGEEKYLEPVVVGLELIKKYNFIDTKNSEIGSEAWVAGMLKDSEGFSSVIEQWRIITGNKTYDDVLMVTGSNYLKYRISGDKNYIVKGSQRIIDGIIYDKELISTEGYYTDRIEIGDIHKSEVWASSHLESTFLGSTMDEGFHPFYHISWSGFGDDFAALVVESNSKYVKVLVYNFLDQPRKGELSLWHLLPGKYQFSQGSDLNEDDEIDELIVSSEFEIEQRFGSVELSLPSRQLQVITIQSTAEYPLSPNMCDLAINKNEIIADVSVPGIIKLSVPVHNIGISDAENINVGIYDGEKLIKSYSIDEISAPMNLDRKTVMLEMELERSVIENDGVSIRIDPENVIKEITLKNNVIFYHIQN
ncbi:CARDB domain-containing protein [Bacteroidota bacterium]